MDEKDKLLFKYGKDRYFLVNSAHLSIYRVTKKKPYTVISCGDTSLENVQMLGGHCTNTGIWIEPYFCREDAGDDTRNIRHA